jgi:uncharacterized membrane protein YhaH (DUF805 family)
MSMSMLTARLGRVHFLGFAMSGVALVLASALALGMAAIEVGAETAGLLVFALGLAAAVVLLLLLLAIRRCHDIGARGWFAAIVLLPPLGLLLLLLPGSKGGNRFGPRPAPARLRVALPTIALPLLLLAACVVAGITAMQDFDARRDRAGARHAVNL